MSNPRGARIGRREFMGASAAAAGVMILKPRVAFGSQANSAVRLALLGCGGRGSGVMASFLEHTGAVLTALGDAFPDQLEKAKARLDELKINLSNTVIESPVDGFIGKRYLDPGATVSPNAPVASVVDIHIVRMVANVVEKDVKRLHVGMPALVEVDAFPGEKFTGKVSRIAAYVLRSSGNAARCSQPMRALRTDRP